MLEKFKMFLKTGKNSPYFITREYILNKENLQEIKNILLKLEESEKDDLIKEVWDEISEEKQKFLVSTLYLENWENLLQDYWGLAEQDKIRTLEILGYVPQKEVVNFLMEQLKSQKEIISLSASAALKKQPVSLTLDPLLKALTLPDQWLPARVYHVLKGRNEEILPILLTKVNTLSLEAQQVIVQIFGDMKEESCLPVLGSLAKSPNNILRKRVAEALSQLTLKSSWPILVEMLNDSLWPIRLQAVETLGKLGVEKTLPFLEERKLVEEDTLVLECIQEAIEKIEEAQIPVAVNWVRK